MSVTTTTVTEPVLKLRTDQDRKDDMHKTVEQLGTGQYSMRSRQLVTNQRSYEEASATAKVDKKIILRRSENFVSQAPYGDWRDELIANGYAVVKGAIPRERAQKYEKEMHDWVRSFKSTQLLDLNDPSTWIESNLPSHSQNNIYSLYASSHEKFMWDLRMEPGVLDAFEKIWGTDKLLVSFDGFNFALPNRKDVPKSGAWPHVDQSPMKDGMQCIQGIINLSNATGKEDGSLIVFKGSNKVLEEFFNTQTNKEDWNVKDSYHFTALQLEWFAERGCEILRVSLEPGDLIVWDSRTIHYGGAPGPSSNQIRSVIYASYSPSEFASEESLEAKRRIFKKWKGTTHWAHDNVDRKSVV